jgi:hypothetical protein
MKTTRVKAAQAHPVPTKVMSPTGPFPQELFRESRIVSDYFSEAPQDGSDFPVGSTAQNNFQGARMLVCSQCDGRVLEHKTGDHVCKEN